MSVLLCKWNSVYASGLNSLNSSASVSWPFELRTCLILLSPISDWQFLKINRPFVSAPQVEVYRAFLWFQAGWNSLYRWLFLVWREPASHLPSRGTQVPFPDHRWRNCPLQPELVQFGRHLPLPPQHLARWPRRNVEPWDVVTLAGKLKLVSNLQL